MTNGTVSDKQSSARNFAKLAFVFGVISLVGLLCCFPLMPVAGGLGIIFALISRGGANAFSPDAHRGLIFSVIGTSVSLVLTIGVLIYSVTFTMNELKTNDKFVDQMREQYEQLYDNAGMEMPEDVNDMLDMMEKFSEEYRNR